MRMFQKIRKIIGTAQVKEPIADQFLYKDNKKSFAGNTLEGANVLVVTNWEDVSSQVHVMKRMLDSEKCNYSILHTAIERFCITQIDELAGNFIGSIDHIINVLDVNMLRGSVIMPVYKCLQAEAEYAIGKMKGGGICVAVRYDSNIDSGRQAEINTLSKAVNGLGSMMVDHGIIMNGVIIHKSVPLEDELAAVIYLCSKYGQILTGEVLEMSV